jgi:Schlafen, AlbA_2
MLLKQWDRHPIEPRASDLFAALKVWGDDETPLLGVFESQRLEFKRAPYPLDNDPGRAEFAKDIAAMSNAGGGVIILGIETSRDPGLGRDRSVGLRPLSPGSCNAHQKEHVAKTWIYPPERGLRIGEWPNSSGDAMLVSIEVPPFPHFGGFALVLGPGDPPDRRTLGVPIRGEASIDFRLASEVYEWIRQGRLLTEAGSNADARVLSANSRQAADAQLERVRSEFIDTAPEGFAVFLLQAWPSIPVRLENMFDLDGPRSLFSNPPPHRSNGFKWWGLEPEADAGQGLRVSRGQTLSLWITREGVMTFALGQEYLTWETRRYGVDTLINPFPLAEFTFELCRTYLLVASMCTPLPPQATFRIGVLQALTPLAIRLSPGAPHPFFDTESTPANQEEMVDELGPLEISLTAYSRPQGAAAGERAQELTASLLRRFYGLFGLGKESVPFLDDSGDRFEPDSLK